MLKGNSLYRTFVLLAMFGALLAVLVPGINAADDLDSSRQQLIDIEQQLEKTMADLARKKVVENDVLKNLELVDRQLVRLRKRVAEEKKRLKSLNKTIADENVELVKSEKAVAELKAQVQKRLVAMYKTEETGVLKTLFSAQNISSLLENYDYLGRVVQHDIDLLDEFRQRVERRQSALNRLSAAKTRQQLAAKTLKGQEQALKRTVRLKKRYLAVVRKDRTTLDRLAADLKSRAERLTVLVADLEAGGAGTGDVSLFKLQKGLLPWPVNGRIKTPFGTRKHPELGTLLENHGIDIFAKAATGVKAVWDGRVAFANRFKGYGNLIIIDHGGGYYTLYAQVQKLLMKTDDKVKKGDLIAYTGFNNTDHLYFEVRKGRRPVDPLLWIEKH